MLLRVGLIWGERPHGSARGSQVWGTIQESLLAGSPVLFLARGASSLLKIGPRATFTDIV